MAGMEWVGGVVGRERETPFDSLHGKMRNLGGGGRAAALGERGS